MDPIADLLEGIPTLFLVIGAGVALWLALKMVKTAAKVMLVIGALFLLLGAIGTSSDDATTAVRRMTPIPAAALDHHETR